MNDLWHIDSENYRAAYYETIEKAKIELPSHLFASISTPEALALPALFLQQGIRLLIMGQETRGNHQHLCGCGAYEAWSRQIGGRIAFDYADGAEASMRASKFWRAFDEIREGLGFPSKRAVAWSNLVKVQLISELNNSFSISRLSANDQMSVIRWQRKLFDAEMGYIKPNAIFFLTGHLHWVANHMFEDHQLITKETFSVVKIPNLDIPMVQTSHPNSRKGAAVDVARLYALNYLRDQLGAGLD